MEILKIVLIFVLIMFFLGKKMPLIIVMPAASVLLAVLFSVPALTFISSFAMSFVSRTTLEVLLTMYFIMLLEKLMMQRGYSERLLSSMDNLFHSKRMNISLLPMLIGFLPSAGGALFSAPMVGNAAKDTALTPEDKTFLNSLYRHLMEIFFPTYPYLIIASQLSGLPFSRLLPILFPMAIIVYVVGQLYMRKLPRRQAFANIARGKMIAALLGSIWPLLILILLMMTFSLRVYAATAIALAALIVTERLPLRDLPRLLISINFRLLIMVLAVMAFKDTLILCGVMDILPGAISSLPIPAFLTFSLMAVLVAFATGLSFATVGIVLPLALAGASSVLPITVLIVLSTYCGIMITPMHLCIALVAEYFKANLRRVLAKSLLPYFVIYMLSIGYYLLLSS